MRILLICLMLISHPIAAEQVITTELPQPLVATAWLAENLDRVSIIDVRSNDKYFTAEPVFKRNKKSNKLELVRVGGHIPGASFVRYKDVRGDRIINGLKIKQMLPGKVVFERLMQKVGVNRDSNIVIVTNAAEEFDLTMASRMYWQIKYYGHDNVSILNGGTAQWLLDGRAVSTTVQAVNKGNWVVRAEKTELLANSEEVLAAIDVDAIQIVDVRPLGQYLGTYKSSKVKEKGHIPSAKLYPVDLTLTRNMPIKFASATEAKEVTKALGVDLNKDAITYCNSGHMASGGWFVLHEILGMNNTKLYDGSMHQWTAEKRPVVRMKLE